MYPISFVNACMYTNKHTLGVGVCRGGWQWLILLLFLSVWFLKKIAIFAMNVMIGGGRTGPKNTGSTYPGAHTPTKKHNVLATQHICSSPCSLLPTAIGPPVGLCLQPIGVENTPTDLFDSMSGEKAIRTFPDGPLNQITVTIKFGKRDTWPALLSYILVSCCGIISGPRESTPWPLAACSSMQSPHLEVPPNSLYLWVSVSGQIGKNSSCDANVVVWSLYS